MTNLDEYVKKELNKGFSATEVKKTLLKAGWDEKEVVNALKNNEEKVFPQHKHAIPKVWIAVVIILLVIGLVGGALYKYSYYENAVLKKCQDLPNIGKRYKCAYDNGLIKAVEKDEKEEETKT